MLEVVDLSRSLDKSAYRKKINPLQERLWELQRLCWRASIPVVIVFEGWDAAGKGRCVAKLTGRLEPRGFEVHHVTGEPRTHELDLPWMWPFWVTTPRRGKIAIFDRSWNHRALVDRVANPKDEMRWRRALRDIGDYERWLSDDGYVLIKFFLHISPEEQLGRYQQREEDPGLSWKALEGVWQKPTHYSRHLAAAEELLQNTEVPWSPWTIVPATDSRWARFQVLDTVVSRLEAALEERGESTRERREAGGSAGAEDEAC
ncbi:MAG: polyphosphate kinase 2 family protein [Thermoanaerobaculia bacterium]